MSDYSGLCAAIRRDPENKPRKREIRIPGRNINPLSEERRQTLQAAIDLEVEKLRAARKSEKEIGA